MKDYSIVLEKTKMIDEMFRDFYQRNKEILSVFVVGSMHEPEKYIPRQNNDYDIRILVEKVSPELLQKAETFQKEICENLCDDEVLVEYNNLVGPVNHSLSEDKCNLLVHLLIHTVDDLSRFLPVTHQRKYRRYHRIVCGEDYLNNLEEYYQPEYLISSHEGIEYCVDMLQRRVYKYLIWNERDGEVSFDYMENPVSDELKYEMIFYSVKNIVWNLYETCVIDKGEEVSVQAYAHYLAGDNKVWHDIMDAVMARDEIALEKMGESMNQETIDMLEYVKEMIAKGAVVYKNPNTGKKLIA